MIRVCVVCEGQTEVEFVLRCMAPYLVSYDVLVYPAILQSPSGRHRGGHVSIERLARFISHQYFHADRITTLVDYYGFYDLGARTRQQLEADILAAVQTKNPDIDVRYVLPYVQMYEFEGLLFSDIEQFQFVLDGWNDRTRTSLLGVRQQFQSPEDINNSRDTAPSKRILSIFNDGTYSKTEHGPLIAEAIGVDVMRQQCPQFDSWLACLQGWGV